MWMRLHESHGSPTPQNPWSPGTQGVGWPSPEELRLLFSQVDEVARCLVIKYLLTETPMTKTDIARALGWGKNTQYVDRILRRCQGGGDDGNDSTTAMPEITMTVRELEEVVRECISGNCGRIRELIRMARLREFETNANISLSPLMLIMSGFAVAMLRNFGLSARKIQRITAVNRNALKYLLRLGDVFEFSRASEFKPRTVFDAYWQFTSLVTLRLPFIIKSRFDPHNDVCGVFKDEGLCHMFIAGYLIAESWKSTEYPSRRFKQVGTTNPASVVTMLSIANHLVKHGIKTKAYINGRQREVYFTLDDLPKDVERFVEDVWGDPVALTKLSDGEFLAFLSGLIAGDGSIVWSRGDVVVALTGDLRKEERLYVVIHGELKRRLGIEVSLRERKDSNAIVLYTRNDDAVRLLRMLPPLIEPLKELRRQLVLKRDVIGVFTAKKIFELLGDEKRNGEKGIYRLQSYQATRFLMVLLRLRLIKLKPEEGHYILETPTNPHGRALKTTKTTPGTGT